MTHLALDIESYRLYALGGAAIGQTTFVLLYALWPWWKEFLGQALFFKGLVLMLILDLGFVFRVIDWPYEDLVFTILYYLFAIGVWGQTLAFLYVRYGKRFRAKDEEAHRE